jgi:hypothetical protein
MLFKTVVNTSPSEEVMRNVNGRANSRPVVAAICQYPQLGLASAFDHELEEDSRTSILAIVLDSPRGATANHQPLLLSKTCSFMASLFPYASHNT